MSFSMVAKNETNFSYSLIFSSTNFGFVELQIETK